MIFIRSVLLIGTLTFLKALMTLCVRSGLSDPSFVMAIVVSLDSIVIHSSFLFCSSSCCWSSRLFCRSTCFGVVLTGVFGRDCVMIGGRLSFVEVDNGLVGGKLIDVGLVGGKLIDAGLVGGKSIGVGLVGGNLFGVEVSGLVGDRLMGVDVVGLVGDKFVGVSSFWES